MWVGLELFPREFNYTIPRSLHLLDMQRAVFNTTPQCRQNEWALSSHKAKSFFFPVMHTLKKWDFSSYTDNWLWIDNHTELWGNGQDSEVVLESDFEFWLWLLKPREPLSTCNLKLHYEGHRQSAVCKSLCSRKGVITCSGVSTSKEVHGTCSEVWLRNHDWGLPSPQQVRLRNDS